jgi:hypothetical protein
MCFAALVSMPGCTSRDWLRFARGPTFGRTDDSHVIFDRRPNTGEVGTQNESMYFFFFVHG